LKLALGFPIAQVKIKWKKREEKAKGFILKEIKEEKLDDKSDSETGEMEDSAENMEVDKISTDSATKKPIKRRIKKVS
jgi:hypothetical protein